jgi:hypothetical protein
VRFHVEPLGFGLSRVVPTALPLIGKWGRGVWKSSKKSRIESASSQHKYLIFKDSAWL